MEWDCFFIYLTQITLLENGKKETWMSQPLFFKNLWFKPRKVELSRRTTNANVERACFSINIHNTNHPAWELELRTLRGPLMRTWNEFVVPSISYISLPGKLEQQSFHGKPPLTKANFECAEYVNSALYMLMFD